MRKWDVKPRAKESGTAASSKFLSRPCGKGKTSVFSSVLLAVERRLGRAVKSNGFILEFHSQSSINRLRLRALSLRGILGLFAIAELGIQPVLQGGRVRHRDDVVP